jgi:hypothetical protein
LGRNKRRIFPALLHDFVEVREFQDVIVVRQPFRHNHGDPKPLFRQEQVGGIALTFSSLGLSSLDPLRALSLRSE